MIFLFSTILPHFRERGNIRFLGRISYLLDIRESALFSAMMTISHGIAVGKKNDRPKGICSLVKYRMKRTKGNETPLKEQGQERLRAERQECRGRQALCAGVQGMQSPWAESRGGSLWSVSRGETFGPGAGRQRLLQCPEGETLWPR